MKSKINVFFRNKYIYTFLMAFMSYITMLKKMNSNVYSFVTFFFFFLFYFFFYKIDYKKIRGKKAPFLYAIFFSIILIIGDILYIHQANKDFVFLRELFHLKNVVYLCGYFNLFYAIFSLILPFLLKVEAKEEKEHVKSKKVFLLSFLILFFAHLPYFLAYFPANMTSDTLSEFGIFIHHFSSMSDHHPVLHYVFMSIPYSIGMFLFHNSNIATSFITITQMILMNFCFSYAVTFLYKRGFKILYCCLLVLLYAFLPIFGFYSTILWKDILFSGLFLLFVIELVRLSEIIENYTIKDKIRFVILSLLLLLFRNNAIYMYFLVFLSSLVVFWKQRKNIIIIFLVVIGSYFMIKGPIFSMFSVEKPSSKEYIAIPLQQVGRLAYKEVKFTKRERELLNKLIDVDVLSKKYNPQTVDTLKFDKAYHSEVLDNHMGDYVKLYLSFLYKHPIEMIEGYLVSTLGFYYPNVYYEPVAIQIDSNEWNIKRDSLLPHFITSRMEKLKSLDVPFLSILWSIGLWIWVLFFLLYIAYLRGGIFGIYPYLPLVFLWITVMVATPLYIELRYVYGLYTAMPFLILYLFGLGEKKKVRSKRK